MDAQWAYFGSHLRIEQAQIEKIAGKYQNTGDRVVKILMYWWREARKQQEAMQTLAYVLSELKLDKLAGDILTGNVGQYKGILPEVNWSTTKSSHNVVVNVCIACSMAGNEAISFVKINKTYTKSNLFTVPLCYIVRRVSDQLTSGLNLHWKERLSIKLKSGILYEL